MNFDVFPYASFGGVSTDPLQETPWFCEGRHMSFNKDIKRVLKTQSIYV